MTLQELLNQYGWNDALAGAFAEHATAGLAPARVTAVHRGRWAVVTAGGEGFAAVSGRLRREAPPGGLPVVGDWVALRDESGGDAVIHAVVPRISRFSRWDGEAVTDQVLAANLDTVFLMASLNSNLNLRRIERYLSMAWEGGAVPVVVLTKADLAEDPGERVAEVAGVAPGVAVHAVSVPARSGLEALDAYLAPGVTVALLGSSGVGKSTLVNHLLGADRQRVAGIREDDRGRHTTTGRELIRLPGGALVIDTPGLRTVLLSEAPDGVGRTFLDVTDLAAGCRFADCRHDDEPGCAVVEAVALGVLDPARLAAWRKLQREVAFVASKTDPRVAAEKRRHWRAIARANRAAARGR